MSKEIKKIAVLGAGPAGLTAAYLLCKAGQHVVVFERDSQYVGGISRTESYKGFLFDIGGHRFFSKSKEVEDFWTEILGDDLLERPRSSRIYYNKKYFSYPLAAMEALRKLGVIETARCVASYLQAKVNPVKDPQNFEDWVTNHFGKRLFIIFFKTYTEKVWGISCKEISADWAAQRIKGLSLSSAIKNAFMKPSDGNKGKLIKTLIDTFRYPKKGPGMMWEACAAKILEMGGEIRMDTTVAGLKEDEHKWTIITAGEASEQDFDYVISSAAIKDLMPNILPVISTEALQASKRLHYRDFITVVLIMKEQNLFDDNWIYIHDPSVKVGRVQNFKSWSPYMVPDPSMACYGLEYFCFKGDGMWNSTNEELIELGKKELEQIGLGKGNEVLDGYVVRQPKAYPVYDKDYKNNIEIIRKELSNYPGLYLVGRNGMHKYNNQDHSMMTAMLAVKNILSGEELYDLWNVNQDAEYHESGERGVADGGRMVPRKVEGQDDH
ncbi:MAG: NAD(P)/FAD-dependent oxidoreductase [Chitinophagaceae bacterium]|nr:NAD(P)/FAD-dependent oxidoreductase [Chitinophagaceae bacterium]